MLTATQFNEIADALFERLVETIDATEAADDIELNQGVLEITCISAENSKSKIIVNRHAPTQEIWVAAKSGGYHFKSADGVWVDTRSGELFFSAMSRVLFEQSKVRVAFD
jgi:CyaY protein